MLKEANNLQYRYREVLDNKNKALAEAKVNHYLMSVLTHAQTHLHMLQSQLIVQSHEMNTLKSASSLSTTVDRAKFLDTQSKITELETALNDRTQQVLSQQQRVQDLEAQLKDHQVLKRRSEELTESLRTNRLALEAAEKNRLRLERALEQSSQSVKQEEKRSSASVQLLQVSESALAKLNEKLRDEVEQYRRQLEEERMQILAKDAAHQQLKQDYQHIKRRLDKRETMIGMALNKLEVRSLLNII
jgi:hypothetical protein